ncbi:MAG: hypothetical protein ACE5F1_13510 [Planctomycetota bacterium]
MSRVGFLLTLPLVLATAAGAQDTIRLSNGKTVENVRVTSYDLHELNYKKGARTKTIPRDQILDVTLGQAGYLNRIRKAKDAEVEEDYATAVDEYLNAGDKLLKHKTLSKFAPQFAFWSAYLIARDQGFDWSQILQLFQELQQKVPETAFVPDIWRLRIRKAWYAGTDKAALENAKRGIQAFRKDCEAKGLSNRFKYEAELLLILARMRLKDRQMGPDKAQSEFAKLEAKCEGLYPDLLNRLKLESARTTLLSGKTRQARELFQLIIDSGSADDETLAGAYLGRGHCSWRKPGRTPEDMRQSLLDYMRVSILFPDVDHETVGEALYHALQAYSKWSPNATTETRRIYTKLRTKYRDSSWASK